MEREHCSTVPLRPFPQPLAAHLSLPHKPSAVWVVPRHWSHRNPIWKHFLSEIFWVLKVSPFPFLAHHKKDWVGATRYWWHRRKHLSIYRLFSLLLWGTYYFFRNKCLCKSGSLGLSGLTVLGANSVPTELHVQISVDFKWSSPGLFGGFSIFLTKKLFSLNLWHHMMQPTVKMMLLVCIDVKK